MISDVSGTRTLGYSVDLLGRVGCVQDASPTADVHGACSSGANPFVKNTYDADPGGVTWTGTNYAVGQLTQSYAINYFSSPDNTQGKVTENFQYDQRGRQITQRLNITATGGTLVFPTFPQYQESLSYNDADQATMTQTTVGGNAGYTFTQSYDSTSGVLNGLSTTSIGNQSLAALSYNAQNQLSTLLFKSTAGTNLAQVAYTYDGNLRLNNASATWQSGSGQSGTIFSEGTSYDAVSNVLSQVMQQAAVPGQSNSGGTEAQNFCYDEQNRLVWAGNSGTVPAAGNGTCGNQGFQSTLGGTYANSYTYTNLGQVWKAPLNGNGTQEQYLYCNSSQPHQVTALTPVSSSPTCSNSGTPDYQASYDSWGNMSSRTTSGSTGALSSDGLDHLLSWNASFGSTNNEEWYMYDGTGNRVLRRFLNSSGTTFVTYPFGLEEHTYGSSGTDQGDSYYYTIGGTALGELSVVGSAQTTKIFLTDGLGTIVSSFTNVGGSAVLNGNQAYGPYGNRRYHSGTLGTSKGFTGQYNDSNSGLDYYNARYYDPVVGVFVSADVVQGNGEGMNPYGYVAGNPESWTDPTGQSIWGDLGGLVQNAEQEATQVEQAVVQFVDTEPLPVVAATAVVAAPVVLPVLAVAGIELAIGLVAAAALVALTPQNLASGTLPPASPIGFNPPRQNNDGPSPPQIQAGGGGQKPPKGPPTATTPPNPEGGQDPRIAKSGTLRDLANKGYKMNSHFVDEFLKEKGLSAGDVENILKNGDYYHRYIDTFDRVTGETLGRNPRIFTIVYNQFADELYTIFEGNIPSNSSSFEWRPNPFDP